MSLTSNEAARRYCSVQYLLGAGTPRVNQPLPARPDSKFFDAEYNKWNIIHNSGALKKSIQCFADLLPIATTLHKNNRRGPRLLVFSVDVLGETVTFDSYLKSDGSTKTEYGKCETYTAQKYNDNLGHDPKHVLDGMLVLKSEFCEVSHAPIESHMRQGF